MTRRLVAFVAVAYLLAVTVPMAAHAATTNTAKQSTSAATTSHHSKEHHSSSKSTKTPKIDLNTAPESELAALPGLDATLASKIVASRPFKSSSELVSKGILSKDQFSKIQNHVMAHQAKSTAKSAEKPATKDKDAMKAQGSTEGTTK